MSEPTKRRRGCLFWIGVVGAVTTAGLSITIYAIKSTGRARLRAELAAIAAAGESLDPAKFERGPMPPPDERADLLIDQAAAVLDQVRGNGASSVRAASRSREFEQAVDLLCEAERRPEVGWLETLDQMPVTADDLEVALTISINDSLAARETPAAYDRIAAKLMCTYVEVNSNEGWQTELTAPSGTASLLARAAAIGPPTVEQRARMLRWIEPVSLTAVEVQIDSQRASVEAEYDQFTELRDADEDAFALAIGARELPQPLRRLLVHAYGWVFLDIDHADFLAYTRESLVLARHPRAVWAAEPDPPEPVWPLARAGVIDCRGQRAEDLERRALLARLRAVIEAAGR